MQFAAADATEEQVTSATKRTVANLFDVTEDTVQVSASRGRRLEPARPRQLTGSWLVDYQVEVAEKHVAEAQDTAEEIASNSSMMSLVSESLKTQLVAVGVDEQSLDDGFSVASFEAVVLQQTPAPQQAGSRPAGSSGHNGPVSARTCSELGWSDNITTCAGGGLGVAGVCASPTSDCTLKSVRKGDAEAVCLGKGARLCSESELRSLEAAGTGCGLDANRVWSNTPCGGSYSFVSVQTNMACGGAASPESFCEPASTSVSGGRCCADADNTASSPLGKKPPRLSSVAAASVLHPLVMVVWCAVALMPF